MKMLLGFEDWVFESAGSDLNQDQEDFLNRCTDGTWNYNDSTGLVDVEGDFDCSNEKLENMHGIKFGKVSGYFDCSNNVLKSLQGSPREVGGDFKCSNNMLTSLKGSPREVGGDFKCTNNDLTSLEGAPQGVGGNFLCYSNPLTSLIGAPRRLSGGFYSDVFQLGSGEWNTEGWLEILKEADGTPKAQSLILTILTPEVLNQEIQKDPGGMLMVLKPVWKDPVFQDIQNQLRFPAEFGDVDKTIKSLKKLDDIRDLI